MKTSIFIFATGKVLQLIEDKMKHGALKEIRKCIEAIKSLARIQEEIEWLAFLVFAQ